MKLANPNPIGLDFRNPKFYDKADLKTEMDRVFDICHGCRLCFNLCPSFPALFDAVDSHENEVAGLTQAEKDRVVDLCYECKLCNVKCPYIPPHEYNLDFPRLMLRARALRGREHGATISDRLLGMTDLMGKIGSLLAPLMNAGLKSRWNRALMEKVAGIDRRRLLPIYAHETLARWWSKRGGAAPARNGKVALFATCSVNYNDPRVGRAAAFVLEKNGVAVTMPPQECCGMPYLDGGLMEQAAAQVERNVARLAPLCKDGHTVVVPGPTCTFMIRNEWPELVKTDDARLVASKTMDLSAFLLSLKEALNRDFPRPLGKIAYHVPCHLKALNIGLPSRDLLARVPGSEIEVIDRCSGVDGTWGLKHAYYDMSVKIADKLVTRVADPDRKWDVVVSDCPLSGLTIEERTTQKPVHPIVAIANAYGWEDRP
ncbi:MAG: heterodisulfide reductase-related iron-sulfur binding cluster [Acidobacteriota bacterium]